MSPTPDSDGRKPFIISIGFVVSRQWLEAIVFTAILFAMIVAVVARRLKIKGSRSRTKHKSEDRACDDLEKCYEEVKMYEKAGEDSDEIPIIDSVKQPDGEGSLGKRCNESRRPPSDSFRRHRTCSDDGESLRTPLLTSPIPASGTSSHELHSDLPQQTITHVSTVEDARGHDSLSRKRLRESENKLRNAVLARNTLPVPIRKHQMLDAAAEIISSDQAELMVLRAHIRVLRRSCDDLEQAALKWNYQEAETGWQGVEEVVTILNTIQPEEPGSPAWWSKDGEDVISSNDANNVTAVHRQQANLLLGNDEAEMKKEGEGIQIFGSETRDSAVDAYRNNINKDAVTGKSQDSSLDFSYTYDPDYASVLARIKKWDSILSSRNTPSLPSFDASDIHKDIAFRGPCTNTVRIGPAKWPSGSAHDLLKAMVAAIPDLTVPNMVEAWFGENRRFLTIRFDGGTEDAERFVQGWDAQQPVECLDALLWYVTDSTPI